MANSSRPRRRLSEEGAGVWTDKEHSRFLEAMELYPKGPWKLVSEYVGTRNPRQTMTHAQKYRQKLERHQRGLRTKRKDAADFDETVTKRSKKDPLTSLLPFEYGSPKDVSTEGWMGPMEALLYEQGGMGATAAAKLIGDVDSLLPPVDLEPRVLNLVDSQSMWLDDCLEYFIESFS